jgi:hypothetical protein
MAGVFFGILKERTGNEATLQKVRRIYSWSGARTIEDIADKGVTGDRITCEIDEIIVLDVCQINVCTETAVENLKNQPIWTI